MERPLVSFVTPMKEQDFRILALLKSIRTQNYPREKVEIIIVDGGSNPAVLQKCAEYGVKIYFNEKGVAEGKGMGKDQGIWKSSGKYVVIAEADIRLIGSDWIEKMVEPLERDDGLFGCVPRLYVDKGDNIVNRYLSYVGVDPFAVFRSLEGQLALDKVPLFDAGNYYRVSLNPEKPYCMGSNGFMFRRDLIKRVGDYAQDVEFIARLAKNGFIFFALPKEARVFHANVKGFLDFLKKRCRWTKGYGRLYIKEKKNFVWITDRTKFLSYVVKNLLIFPNIPVAVKNCVKYRDICWLLHPILLFISTFINLYYSLWSREILKSILFSNR